MPENGPVTLDPKGLLDEHERLGTTDISDVYHLTWTGCFLPTNESEFKARYNFSANAYGEIRDVADPLLKVFGDIKGTCTQWNNKDYNDILDLASKMREYADDAGDDETSYYGTIFDEITKLGSETDPNKIQVAKKMIGQLIDDRIAKIAGYVTDAATIAKTLLTFENNLTAEQKNLDPRIKAVVNKLSGEGGDIARLTKDIEEIKADITKAQEEDRVGVEVSDRTSQHPLIAWTTSLGSLFIKYGGALYFNERMKKEVNKLNSLLAADNDILEEKNNLVASLKNAEIDMKSLAARLEPAIKAVRHMEGSWTLIKGDLNAINSFLDKDTRSMKDMIAGIQKKQILSKWKKLGKELKDYIETAFNKPKEMTLKEYMEELDKADKARRE